MNSSFKEGQLSDLVDFKNGRAIKSTNGDIPIYGGNGILGWCSDSNYSDTLIIGRVGAYCGSVHIERDRCWVSDNAIAGIPRKGTYNAYNYYLLKGLDLNKIHIGSSQPLLTQEILKNILVKIEYDFHKQKNLVKVIEAIDKKIKLNNKINAELEAMAKLIYDYWFVQFDFPDANGKPYKSSGGEMVFNEELKREIPAGWEVNELDECIETILDHRGKTPKKLGSDWTEDEEGILALSAKLVKGGKLINLDKANKVDTALYEKWMPKKLEDGDILMTSEAPAGEFYFIYGETNYCMSQRLFAIRAKQTLVVPSYLYYELSKGHGYSQILGSLSGSTVFGIRQDVLRTIKVVIPKLHLQKNFNEIVLPQLKEIKNLDRGNLELEKLRDWLLPMLMNGQVTVNEP